MRWLLLCFYCFAPDLQSIGVFFERVGVIAADLHLSVINIDTVAISRRAVDLAVPAAVCWPVSALVHAIVDRHSGKGKKGGDGK